MKSDMKDEPFQKFYNKLWQVIKEFWIPEDTDEYWENLISTLDDLYKEYNSRDDIKRMILAFAEGREIAFKEVNKVDKNFIVSVSEIKKLEVDGTNVINLNGEKYIKISSL